MTLSAFRWQIERGLYDLRRYLLPVPLDKPLEVSPVNEFFNLLLVVMKVLYVLDIIVVEAT